MVCKQPFNNLQTALVRPQPSPFTISVAKGVRCTWALACPSRHSRRAAPPPAFDVGTIQEGVEQDLKGPVRCEAEGCGWLPESRLLQSGWGTAFSLFISS